MPHKNIPINTIRSSIFAEFNTKKIHILLSLFSEIKGLMLFSAFQFRLFIQFNENVVIKLVLSNGYRKEQKP